MHRILAAMLMVTLITGCFGRPLRPERMRGADFAWLSGCWQWQAGEQSIDERWSAPALRGLSGVSRSSNGGQLVSQELMQLRVGQDGQASFVATLPGQPDTHFPLKRFTSASGEGGAQAVFENLEHDFPHRVIYHQAQPDVLNARIEGVVAQQPKVIRFDYQRVACEG